MTMLRNHQILPTVGSALLLLLACRVLNAFTFKNPLISPARILPTINNGNPLLASPEAETEAVDAATPSTKTKMVLVLGGSGYIGRRVCKELIDNGDDATRIVSISRNGKPPSWSLGIDDGDASWSDQVEWIQQDVGASENGTSALEKTIQDIFQSSVNGSGEATSWETTIVGCIGNVNPTQSWENLWGLAFEDDVLLEENGKVYESFLNATESIRASNAMSIDRCVLLSLDYTLQKCLEGPIEGYVDGKRLAEKRFLEAVTKTHGGDISDRDNLDRVVVVGLPNFVYGGKRFPGFGKGWRKFVESGPAKGYVKSQDALRGLSVAEPEDWVEKSIFSSPVDVNTVGAAAAMAARGMVTRDLVNDGEPRKQGFFNTSGLPVVYDDILFLDGTQAIEKVVSTLDPSAQRGSKSGSSKATKAADEPLWEGALIGKRPYLYPWPVAAVFIYIFWGVTTQQFVQSIPS